MDAPWQEGTTLMGIHVDSVSEVLDIVQDEIEPSPSLGDGVDTRFILGVAKCKGGVRLLLNTAHILNPSEARMGASARAEAQAA
jgi:purine-binding chemotaxis protein CheW